MHEIIYGTFEESYFTAKKTNCDFIEPMWVLPNPGATSKHSYVTKKSYNNAMEGKRTCLCRFDGLVG